jgi:hypothetical protein
MRDVTRFANQLGVSSVPSKRWGRIQGTLEEITAMLIEEAGEDEADTLRVATENIWRDIRRDLVQWAVAVET